MPARKNFTKARRHRIARYSKFNPVIATAARFGVCVNTLLRYRKAFGIFRDKSTGETIEGAIIVHGNAVGENKFHADNPTPLPHCLLLIKCLG